MTPETNAPPCTHTKRKRQAAPRADVCLECGAFIARRWLAVWVPSRRRFESLTNPEVIWSVQDDVEGTRRAHARAEHTAGKVVDLERALAVQDKLRSGALSIHDFDGVVHE
jgi:hypothetical protein